MCLLFSCIVLNPSPPQLGRITEDPGFVVYVVSPFSGSHTKKNAEYLTVEVLRLFLALVEAHVGQRKPSANSCWPPPLPVIHILDLEQTLCEEALTISMSSTCFEIYLKVSYSPAQQWHSQLTMSSLDLLRSKDSNQTQISPDFS
jgi:hypothetical protein